MKGGLPIVLLVASLTVGSLDMGARPPETPAGVVTVFESATVLDQARSGLVLLALPWGSVMFSLRPDPIALGATVGIDGEPVARVDQVLTFSGTAGGFPAALAATRAGVFALVLQDDPILIEPLWLSQPGASANLHRVLRWSEAPPSLAVHPEPENLLAGALPYAPKAFSTEPTDRVARFLVEGDYAFYQKATLMGACPDCWVDVQQALMLISQTLFQRQTGVRFQVTSTWICATPAACPYTGGNPQVQLDAFRSTWESRSDEAAHDLGHLFLGADLADDVGYSYIGTVATPFGYAISEFLVHNGGGLLSYAATTHEIGHNFDGVHAEADSIPALPFNLSPVATIMFPGKIVRLQFSDGSIDPEHNNVARIIAHAESSLPAP